MIKLNVCPFCGASARIHGGAGMTQVDCPACGARGPRGLDIPDAVEKWNRCLQDVGIADKPPAEVNDAEGL